MVPTPSPVTTSPPGACNSDCCKSNGKCKGATSKDKCADMGCCIIAKDLSVSEITDVMTPITTETPGCCKFNKTDAMWH